MRRDLCPSAEPSRVQSRGSRSGASLAEARAYLTTLMGLASLTETQPVAENTSHLVLTSPSSRFSFTSPASVYSPLAAISTTSSVTLPGMPPVVPPVIPSGVMPSSTVFSQSG